MSTASHALDYQKLAGIAPPAAAGNTVLCHTPLLKPNGKPCSEIWVHHHVAMVLSGEVFALQAGQAALAWQRRNGEELWQPAIPMTITTTSAFVYDGRYMVKGGTSDPKTHAKIAAWEKGVGELPQQASAELRFPGGVRKLILQALEGPLLVPKTSMDLSVFISTAPLFHAFAREMSLADEGGDNKQTLVMVTPVKESDEDAPLGAASLIGYDVASMTTRMFWELPLPIILSDIESAVLPDHPASWMDAVKQYLDAHNINEIGVMRSWEGTKLPCEELLATPVNVISRAPIRDDSIGMDVLDPALYNRMLPFRTGEVNTAAFM